MGPRLEGGFRVAAGWRLFTEPRRWPLGRAKPLLKSSLSPAAAGAAMGVDFPLGTRGSRLMLSSTTSGPDFPWGADSAPLSASSSTLVRTAERSPSRALTRAPTRPSIQEVARVPRLRDHMLRHERGGIKEALSIAVSAQQGGSRLPSTYRGGRNHLPRATVPPVDPAACSLLPRNPA